MYMHALIQSCSCPVLLGPATSNSNSVSQSNIANQDLPTTINIHSTNKTPAVFQSDVYLRTVSTY